MSTYTLAINAFKTAGNESLFHGPAFFALHDNGTGLYYEWLDDAGAPVARIHFTETAKNYWRSPARGTFAGFDFKTGLDLEALFQFLDAYEADLKARGAQTIEILLPPAAHNPEAFSLTFYLLHARQYETARCDLNYSLNVDTTPLFGRISYGNQKRIKKCRREGFTSAELPLSDLPKVYETLAVNRASKGNALSMSLEQLQAMAQALPGTLVLFGAQSGDVLAASAICLRLSPNILYVFYWGDRPEFQSHSPIVLLAETIYAYCQANDIRILDAGTSTIGDEPNFGLIQFKRNMGFTESLKVTARKTL